MNEESHRKYSCQYCQWAKYGGDTIDCCKYGTHKANYSWNNPWAKPKVMKCKEYKLDSRME